MKREIQLAQISCAACTRNNLCGLREDLEDNLGDCAPPPLKGTCAGRIVEEAEISSPDGPLAWADSALEGANWHSSIGMPASLFAAVKPFLPEADRVKAAVAIAKAVYDFI